ncbi:MAG: hypothetical protein M5Z89_07910 [Olivibacter sp.]|uniref:hypothetical protein n=1 Tax=Olivibacter sp. 47 TaxID=3056486 RepID=UPI0025A3142D|nr:hypothetical protein [Olivibacter sp. 47]MCL4638901.1 hypothetical protein [Olivibacter sp. UJ_SKK_5.1]MDM8177416.1 hypothetical protein [Olivibacter sp. 47]
MRKPIYIILICFVAFVRSTIAQTKPQLAVRLNPSNGIAYIRVFYPELQVDLNGNGQLINTWNHVEEETVSFDYYDQFDNKEKIGKMKSIGNVHIDYYDNFDDEAKRGKVKQIGDIQIDYYGRFDGIFQGKIKSIGHQPVTYYDQFSGNEKKGKLKSIGLVEIDYYDRFDGEHRAGKIKSINGNEQENVHVLFN